MNADFYEDDRFCTRCGTYVNYLDSPSAAFCVHCGDPVELFSPEDRERFQRSLQAMRRDFDLSG